MYIKRLHCTECKLNYFLYSLLIQAVCVKIQGLFKDFLNTYLLFFKNYKIMKNIDLHNETTSGMLDWDNEKFSFRK